uniref:Siglec-like 1 n=1 Tax=Xenopus tropicalis TaxID=8364 RepID=A0A803JPJ7_XENTR
MVSNGTKGRFTLTGKVHEGNCSFSISNAQPADQGFYEFRIEEGSHKYSYSWDKLNVNVTDLPEPTISPVGELIAGKPITLTCTAHPAPQGCKGNITWGGRINIENIYNYEREDQAGKVTSISDITVTPSQREHNSPLTCTVTYSGVSTNSSITLGVTGHLFAFILISDAPRSPAIWDCTSAGCRVEVIEGTSLSLLCSAESNPPANLSWEKMGQSSTDPLNSSSGRLNVGPVTAHNEGEYMCRARNKHGDSTASAIVVIIYAPRRLTITYCNITGNSVLCLYYKTLHYNFYTFWSHAHW